MTDNPAKTEKKHWLPASLEVLVQPKVLVTLAALVGVGGGGLGVKALADAGGADTARIAEVADSVTRSQLAPIIATQKRQDTALMRIYFRQDVQMSETEKTKADSLMRAALRNINYGGSP